MAEEGQAPEAQPALQLPESITPHQAVEALTKSFEAEEKKPRDEQGRFAKTKEEPKSEEAKPETEATKEEGKTEEEAPQTQETEEETKAEKRRLRLKYKGEEIEKDEEEVISLAQQGFDYTQKSQALAKERDELPAKIKAEVDARTKQAVEQLEIYQQAVLKLADPEALTADLNKLSLEDPARAQQLFFKRMQIQQTLQGIATERHRLVQQGEAEKAQAKQKQVAESLEAIQREVPGWDNVLYGKLLKTAVDNGASTEVANSITDPWQIKVLNKARQWDEFQAAKPKTVEKRVAQVPKVLKPGTAQDKPNPDAERFSRNMERLNKTGRKEDAVDIFRQLIEAGKI